MFAEVDVTEDELWPGIQLEIQRGHVALQVEFQRMPRESGAQEPVSPGDLKGKSFLFFPSDLVQHRTSVQRPVVVPLLQFP